MEELKELKKGDVVYRIQFCRVYERYSIDRITKKLAISGEKKFKKIYSMGLVDALKREAFSSYRIETSELKKEYELKLIREKLERINFSKLTEEQMIAIEKIINP